MTKDLFTPLFLLLLDLGSGMGKNQDPKSGINIPDPQHCLLDNIFQFPQKWPGSTGIRNKYLRIRNTDQEIRIRL
jgi:hypothetical protein